MATAFATLSDGATPLADLAHSLPFILSSPEFVSKTLEPMHAYSLLPQKLQYTVAGSPSKASSNSSLSTFSRNRAIRAESVVPVWSSPASEPLICTWEFRDGCHLRRAHAPGSSQPGKVSGHAGDLFLPQPPFDGPGAS